jgi:hypothetical protein
MLKSKRTVLDVLFPEVRVKLLRLFFTTPPKQYHVRELRNLSGLALHTVQDELRKLSPIGLLESWSNGYHRFYRANPNHAMYPQLLRVVQLNERLPVIAYSALQRSPRLRAPKKTRAKSRPLPVDRQPNRDLFASPRQTRRL